MIKNFNYLFVTFFAIGTIKYAPGTITSLITTVILFIFFHVINLPNNIILLFLILIFLYAFYAITDYIKEKENNKIVIDDYLSKTIQSLTNQETTEIYLKHELHRDLYLTLNGVTPGIDGEPSSATITVREIPGIILVWIGSFLTILGMIMTMFTEWKPGKEWLRKMAN